MGKHADRERHRVTFVDRGPVSARRARSPRAGAPFCFRGRFDRFDAAGLRGRCDPFDAALAFPRGCSRGFSRASCGSRSRGFLPANSRVLSGFSGGKSGKMPRPLPPSLTPSRGVPGSRCRRSCVTATSATPRARLFSRGFSEIRRRSASPAGPAREGTVGARGFSSFARVNQRATRAQAARCPTRSSQSTTGSAASRGNERTPFRSFRRTSQDHRAAPLSRRSGLRGSNPQAAIRPRANLVRATRVGRSHATGPCSIFLHGGRTL